MLMRTFLYLRGAPGSGKITIARLLNAELNWSLFWLHDLDGICRVVGDHRIPRLMDEVTRPILNYLLADSRNIIYVRPSRDLETVAKVEDLMDQFSAYRFVVVSLVADYETLCERVESRAKTEFRISTKASLDEYLNARPAGLMPHEHVVRTDGDPAQAVRQIRAILGI